MTKVLVRREETQPCTEGRWPCHAGGQQWSRVAIGPGTPRISGNDQGLAGPSEGARPRHTSMSDFGLQNCDRIVPAVPSHPVCGDPLHQRQETRIPPTPTPKGLRSCRPAEVQAHCVQTVLGVFWALGPGSGHLCGFLCLWITQDRCHKAHFAEKRRPIHALCSETGGVCNKAGCVVAPRVPWAQLPSRVLTLPGSCWPTA